MFRTIRGRIAFTYVLLIGLVMAALTWYVLGFVRRSYLDQLKNQMTADARLTAEAARPTFLTGGTPRADELADRYAAILGARVTFISGDGTVIGDSEADVETMLNHLQRPEIVAARQRGIGTELRYSDTVEYEALYLAVPVSDDSDSGYVRLAVPLRAIDENVGALRRRILGSTAIMLVVAIVLGVLLAEKTARPIRELTEVVGRVAGGDLSARLVPRSRDEVGTLTRGFSAMTDTLRTTIDDLTRQRAEAAAILEHMADGIVITDDAGRIQLINSAAGRLLGTTEEEARGRSLAQIAREEEIILTLRACLRDRREQNELIELSRSNRLLQLIATPLQSASEEARCLIVLQDLSQLRQLETTRRDLVSNVSHELRTPLASLRAIVDTLRDGALDDPVAGRRFIERMDTEVDDLTQMVERLLELARIESGQAPMRLAPVGVTEFVMPAVERLRPQAEHGDVTLEVAVAEDLPLVLGDRDQLQVVISNLVQNAIKFTPAGGRVSVQATHEAERVTISVTDTGRGISPESLPRIFERFYMADPSRASRGFGLGLAIARHIVQAHGSELKVASMEGKGSTFTFSLLASS